MSSTQSDSVEWVTVGGKPLSQSKPRGSSSKRKGSRNDVNGGNNARSSADSQNGAKASGDENGKKSGSRARNNSQRNTRSSGIQASSESGNISESRKNQLEGNNVDTSSNNKPNTIPSRPSGWAAIAAGTKNVAPSEPVKSTRLEVNPSFTRTNIQSDDRTPSVEVSSTVPASVDTLTSAEKQAVKSAPMEESPKSSEPPAILKPMVSTTRAPGISYKSAAIALNGPAPIVLPPKHTRHNEGGRSKGQRNRHEKGSKFEQNSQGNSVIIPQPPSYPSANTKRFQMAISAPEFVPAGQRHS